MIVAVRRGLGVGSERLPLANGTECELQLKVEGDHEVWRRIRRLSGYGEMATTNALGICRLSSGADPEPNTIVQ